MASSTSSETIGEVPGSAAAPASVTYITSMTPMSRENLAGPRFAVLRVLMFAPLLGACLAAPCGEKSKGGAVRGVAGSATRRGRSTARGLARGDLLDPRGAKGG